MKFTANNLAETSGLHFGAMEETVMEFDAPETEKPNLLTQIKTMFSKNSTPMTAVFPTFIRRWNLSQNASKGLKPKSKHFPV